ncbi:MAG: phosphatase PAP2 family protein, partial [Pseudomonadota bacterium]|nr:phosphatase PAP2 family protein [Pseudomonadota bacterium]
AAGYAAEGIIIHYIKDYFAYPRPYITLGHDHVRVLEMRAGEDYHSFPSGHAAFITLMVIGLWPVLSPNLRWLGTWLIFGVCWSRIALGVHFPVDVLAGYAMAFFLVIALRAIIYELMEMLLGLNPG